MKEFIILIIKGFFIGIGKIIPGVSGAMLAITLGVYEKGLKIISNVFKNIKDNIKFILPIGLGFVLGILLFSKIIVRLLEQYYLPTMLLFIGLILGGIPNIKKEVNLKNKVNIIYFILTLFIIIPLSFLKQDNTATYNFYIIILMGFVEAISMIVPGLSGTALLMTLGYYEIIMNAFSMIDIKVLFPFVIGIVIGAIIISKIINYLFKKHREKTNVVIYGLAVSSVVILLMQTLSNNYNIVEIIISLVLLIVGYNVSKIMEK